MKKIILMLALLVAAFFQNSFGQDSTKTSSPQLLIAYYQVKDALVNSNAAAAATSAGYLANTINGIDVGDLTENTRNLLQQDATAISQSQDIKIQREKFARLSNTMFELAKMVKLSDDPVYQQYCPMKKASWLSNVQAIKNPYFGNAMLTCGSVKSTL
jgi:Protein of unknown function (DUF3347)